MRAAVVPIVLLFAQGRASQADYFKLRLGWDLSVGNADLGQPYGPCNKNGTYIPPSAMLDICDNTMACMSTNYVPAQPEEGSKCAWIKTAGEGVTQAAFVHRTRCNRRLNATLVTSPQGHAYKFCENVRYWRRSCSVHAALSRSAIVELLPRV